jgi:hypothetical protein
MSYKVCKLVKLPSSGGTMPKNWFASRLLFEKKKKKKYKKGILRLLKENNRNS